MYYGKKFCHSFLSWLIFIWCFTDWWANGKHFYILFALMFYSMECTYFVENTLSTGFWRKFVSAFQSKTSILDLALFSSVFETTSESRNILKIFLADLWNGFRSERLLGLVLPFLSCSDRSLNLSVCRLYLPLLHVMEKLGLEPVLGEL